MNLTSDKFVMYDRTSVNTNMLCVSELAFGRLMFLLNPTITYIKSIKGKHLFPPASLMGGKLDFILFRSMAYIGPWKGDGLASGKIPCFFLKGSKRSKPQQLGGRECEEIF